jgi:hypothetical protein
MISCSYWRRSSNRKRLRRGPPQRRYRPSRLPQCRSCRRIHSINLLRLCNSLRLSTITGLRQTLPASPQCLKQVFIKAVHHQLRPIRLQTFHQTSSHFYKAHRLSNNRQVPHSHLKAQRLCLARTAVFHQRCLQDRCVPRCHRIWQGHRRLQCRCKVGWEVIIKRK